MAEEPKNTEKTPKAKAIPHGASVLRAMHSGLKAAMGGVGDLLGQLENADVKSLAEEFTAAGDEWSKKIGEAFGKHYKDLDLEEAEVEAKSETKGEDDGDVEEAIKMLDEEGDDDPDLGDDDEIDESTEEGKALIKQLNELETQVKHQERLTAKK